MLSCISIQSSLYYFYACLLLGYDVKDVGVMVADVTDESSLNAMCSSAKIVLNCVGPVCWLPCYFYFQIWQARGNC